MKRRSTTPAGNLVKSLLYRKPFSTVATRWGSTHEAEAKAEYLKRLREEGYSKADIDDSGLVIDAEHPCLACSPDGLVKIIGVPGSSSDLGILEIKCPYAISQEGFHPEDAAKHSKGFFCKTGANETPELKRSHDYYCQIQGTMAITKRSWCDFVVWTQYGMSVERIPFDDSFWEQAKAKLKAFYETAILPELADPRHARGHTIRERTSACDVTIL